MNCSLQGNRATKEEPITQFPSKQPPQITETFESETHACCSIMLFHLQQFRGQLSPRELDPHLALASSRTVISGSFVWLKMRKHLMENFKKFVMQDSSNASIQFNESVMVFYINSRYEIVHD